jgi:hypothetical protein
MAVISVELTKSDSAFRMSFRGESKSLFGSLSWQLLRMAVDEDWNRMNDHDRLPFPAGVAAPRYPALYQINTRVWMTKLSASLGRLATLDDIPDESLDDFAAKGFDWLWMLTVWQTGTIGQQISRTNSEWRQEFLDTLPDLKDEDIPGSGFAITAYTVHQDLGGDAALARLRERLHQRGLRLMLDFVPNHTAIDHPWVENHREYYIQATEQELAAAPRNYRRVARQGGEIILALGRDPYFPGWPDVLQLNYGDPALQQAMSEELLRIAGRCDGVRCDMAMLVLPEVFERTWGIAIQPFWPRTIPKIREAFPEFYLLAEAYWDMGWILQQQGFDSTYDKRLYDRLRQGAPGPIRDHFRAELAYQDKLARFLENHDEARAATAFPLDQQHQAAAVITFLSPGLRFFHQGEFEGVRKRISPHLGRGPIESVNVRLQQFYGRLLDLLKSPILREGEWQLLEPLPAWEGNWTFDAFITFAWQGREMQRLLVVVNYASHQSQCRLRLPFDDLGNRQWRLSDRFSSDVYDRDGSLLLSEGLYLDLSAWQGAVYSLERHESKLRSSEGATIGS